MTADPLFPNGGRPSCMRCHQAPVYLGGLCGSCYAVGFPRADESPEAEARRLEADEVFARIRETLDLLRSDFRELGPIVRKVDPTAHARFDAYVGWGLNTDVGGGKRLDDWISTLEDALQPRAEAGS